VSEQIGGSPVTVKNAIAALEGDGQIRRAGDKHLGRGRAAKMWMVGSA
jgi:predicted ArsR family transcriptional regulator